ncbi:MAG: radical SAM protein [Elusimicrobia bacterium]|nr:radical SAM protein [Elusimicrobiota bacterium]
MSSYSALTYVSQLKESLFSGGLHTLLFFATSRCDCACPGCCYRSRLNKADDLSLHEISGLCDTLGPFHSLVVTGGEPFLRPDLFQLCRTFLLRNRVRRLTVLTNGAQPDRIADFSRDLLYAHPGLPLSIKVALDGLQELHDGLRARPGAFNDALDSLDKLKRLKKRHPRLEVAVSTLISKDNAGSISSLMDFVFDKVGPDLHEFDFIQGESGTRPETLPDLPELARLQRAVLANKKRSLSGDGAGGLGRFAVLALAAAAQDVQRRRLEGRGPVVPCSAGRSICVVDANGDLRFCPYLPAVGNLRSAGMDFRKLWRSAEARAARTALRSRPCSCADLTYLKASASSGASSALRFVLAVPGALDSLP